MLQKLSPYKMNTKRVTLSANDKLTFINNLATMLSAGISILEAVDSLLEDSKGNMKKLLTVLREDLIQGEHLHETFAKFPGVFDKVTVNIIKASEQAGTLDVTLKDLTNTIQKDIEFSDKIKSALMYPVLIFIVFSGVLLMILIVVVPKISQVFSRLRVTLPLPTRILIFISDLLINNTIPLIAGIAIFIILLIMVYKLNRGLIFGILFSLPVVSTLVKEIDLTRFSRSFYLLLSSGIPITSALELTQDVVARRDIARTIAASKEMVLAGKRLSEGFKANKRVIPTLMVKMMEAGEKTGTLDKSMQEIAEHMDYKVSSTLKILTALLEPVMLVFVGVLIGGMMLAIIAPIYGLIGQVGQR